jgi:hypothetical protein
MKAAEYLPVALLKRGVGLVQGQINTIVTNVPGPQFPLYTVGAKLLGMYPIVPLIPGCGLGIALFSYEGKLCWGFNADHHLIPNLEDLAEDVAIAFEDLRKAAVANYLARRTAPAEKPERPRGTEAMAKSEDPASGRPPLRIERAQKTERRSVGPAPVTPSAPAEHARVEPLLAEAAVSS